MIWKDKEIKTIGELFDAVAAVDTPEQAGEFMRAYRADNEHADASVGYVIGYAGADSRKRLYDLFQLSHPLLDRAAR
jgi:hypothetical protein